MESAYKKTRKAEVEESLRSILKTIVRNPWFWIAVLTDIATHFFVFPMAYLCLSLFRFDSAELIIWTLVGILATSAVYALGALVVNVSKTVKARKNGSPSPELENMGRAWMGSISVFFTCKSLLIAPVVALSLWSDMGQEYPHTIKRRGHTVTITRQMALKYDLAYFEKKGLMWNWAEKP